MLTKPGDKNIPLESFKIKKIKILKDLYLTYFEDRALKKGSENRRGSSDRALIPIPGYIDICSPKDKMDNLSDVELSDPLGGSCYFRLHKVILKKSQIMGYAFTKDERLLPIKKVNNLTPLLIFLSISCLIATICLFLLLYSSKNTLKLPDEPDLFLADNTQKWDGMMPQNGAVSQADMGQIEIPGYSELYISSKDPNVALFNPDGNDVYFVYDILEDQNTICSTKAIAPGQSTFIPLGSSLSKGEHDLTFNISCYDLATRSPCNGTRQNVRLIVQ